MCLNLFETNSAYFGTYFELLRTQSKVTQIVPKASWNYLQLLRTYLEFIKFIGVTQNLKGVLRAFQEVLLTFLELLEEILDTPCSNSNPIRSYYESTCSLSEPFTDIYQAFTRRYKLPSRNQVIVTLKCTERLYELTLRYLEPTRTQLQQARSYLEHI